MMRLIILTILAAAVAMAQSGGVTVTETPVPGTTSSVNTLNTNVQVTGTYTGSASSIAQHPFTGKLSLADALQRGLGYNLGAIGLSTVLRQAKGQERITRSALLPNLNAAFRENYLTEDLKAMGIHIPGIPSVVGPINYYDLRVTLTQNFVDMTSLNNYRASREAVHANEQLVQDARDTIVLAVGASYLQVIAAKARIESAKAQIETAKSIHKQTTQRHEAGLASQLEVNQDLVKLQTQEQRLATLENDLARQKINLARLTGLPPTDHYDISDNIDFSAPPPLAVEDAIKQALESRADLKAAQAQVSAAERSRAAARAERLPTAGVSADVGVIGDRFNDGSHTYTVAGSVKIPIWQGGRVAGDIQQSEAVLDQRRAELEDVRGRIESDIRNAFLDLKASASQLELSRNNQGVARDNLRLTKEKFEVGVSDSVEVVQAVEAVASADLDYITALFAHNLAKLSLARALGGAEKRVPDYLKVTTRGATP